MDVDNEQTAQSFKLTLSNSAEIAGFVVALGIAFSLIRTYFYYVIFLHVPVFQYLETSELVIIAPTEIYWALYVSSIASIVFIVNSKQFIKFEKWGYSIFLIAFVSIISRLAMTNEPILGNLQSIFFNHPWVLLPFMLLVAFFVLLFNHIKNDNFLKRNIYLSICIISIYYAVFDSWSNYDVLQQPANYAHLVIKLKGEKTRIKTNRSLMYAGRTNNYWFLYNNKTHFVRTIKNEDIEIIDFDTDNK